MVKNFLLIVFLISITSCSLNQENETTEKHSDSTKNLIPVEKNYTKIKEEGILNAITIYSSTSYFLFRGQPMGFEYELLTRLAEHLGLKLEITVAKDINELFDMLNRGDGDIIAFGLTITQPRKKLVSFTDHHIITHQALVQRKPANWRNMKLHQIQKELISDAIDLIGDTVHVRRNSSYYDRIEDLSKEIGDTIYIDTVPGHLDTDEIIKMVADGKINYTVADYTVASINSTYYHILDVETPISLSQRLAWAVRKNSPELLEEVNKWIEMMKKTNDYYVIYDKYFKSKKLYKSRLKSEYFSKTTGKISKYDNILKENAKIVDWDWRLLSSLVYQESKFDPGTKSWAGAKGLMQLMPATAREVGVKDPANPEQNIRGGTKYLAGLSQRWNTIPDSIQRIKFTMASYNCGYNHVLDAKRLAKKYGKDENVWDNNVDEFILKLANKKYYNDELVKFGYARGSEPYNYVKEIFARYELYKEVIPY